MMIDIDKVQGKKIIELLKELKEKKIFIKLRIKGKNYERLTLLTEVRKKLGRSYFHIGAPEDYRDVISGLDEVKLDFEFTGHDHLTYSFTATGGEMIDDEVKVPCPDHISRNQRRQNFRLEAPIGSTIDFTVNETKYREKLIDISLGGALVALIRIEKSQKDLPFKVGDKLSDIDMIFPAGDEKFNITVKSANVVRFDKKVSKSGTGCGLQFVDVEDRQLEHLTEFIYTEQRRSLRNRVRVD